MPETTLNRISEHVYWMSPGRPDRPALCAIVGTDHTLVIDAGASEAHTRLFLDALKSRELPCPDYVALTHWHWDHVFGAAYFHTPIIAHTETARQLEIMTRYVWDDVALEARVTTGEEIAFCADNIKLELPEPRSVQIVIPDIVFDHSLDIQLGGVTCRIQHVGGDHASDASAVHILPDRVLVLGDCLYDAIYTPVRHYTEEKLFPLLETILGFDADRFIEGHNPDVLTRAELLSLRDKMHFAASLVNRLGTEETEVPSAIEQPDEDMEFLVRAFMGGKGKG